MPIPFQKIKFYAPAIGWGILICYFSLMRGPEVPPLLKGMRDYFLHFSIYAAFSMLLVLGANQFSLRQVPRSVLLQIVFGAFFMGALIEFLQEEYIPGRHFEWSDLIYNTLGIFMAIPFVLLLRYWQRAKENKG